MVYGGHLCLTKSPFFPQPEVRGDPGGKGSPSIRRLMYVQYCKCAYGEMLFAHWVKGFVGKLWLASMETSKV